MTALTYSRGKNLKDKWPVQCSAASMDEFVEQLDAGRAARKELAAYICGPLGGDGRRCSANALARTWVALDLDGVQASILPGILQWAEGYNGCRWHTHRSTPEMPRLRIVFVLERPADRDECIALGIELERQVLGMFGDAVKWDDCTFRSEQAALVPPPGAHVHRLNGAVLAVPAVQAPGRIEGRKPKNVAQKGTGAEDDCTEEAGRLLKPSSVPSVPSVHAGSVVVGGTAWAIPPDTIPTEAGQRNDWLFKLARHVKGIQPTPTRCELRAIVQAWHALALPAIQTTDFATSLGEFMHAYERVKNPHGAIMDAIIDSIDATVPLPAGVDLLGYGEAAIQLVRICAALQAHEGSDPFFLGARKAGELIGKPYRDANRMMQAFVLDGVIEVVKQGAGMKASRYRFVWNDAASGNVATATPLPSSPAAPTLAEPTGNSSSAPMVPAPANTSRAGTARVPWKIPTGWLNAA